MIENEDIPPARARRGTSVEAMTKALEPRPFGFLSVRTSPLRGRIARLGEKRIDREP